jgi:hypothetical protein
METEFRGAKILCSNISKGLLRKSVADDHKTVLSVNMTSKIIDLVPGRVSGRFSVVQDAARMCYRSRRSEVSKMLEGSAQVCVEWGIEGGDRDGEK